MKKESMTRREVINLLGIKLPVVLLAVEILPGIARADQPYTRSTFQVLTSERDEALTDWYDSTCMVTEYRDANGQAIGTRVSELDGSVIKKGEIREGDIIYKINGKPYIVGSPQDFEEWSDAVRQMVANKQTITVDLDRDDKPNLIVIEFD